MSCPLGAITSPFSSTSLSHIPLFTSLCGHTRPNSTTCCPRPPKKTCSPPEKSIAHHSRAQHITTQGKQMKCERLAPAHLPGRCSCPPPVRSPQGEWNWRGFRSRLETESACLSKQDNIGLHNQNGDRKYSSSRTKRVQSNSISRVAVNSQHHFYVNSSHPTLSIHHLCTSGVKSHI